MHLLTITIACLFLSRLNIPVEARNNLSDKVVEGWIDSITVITASYQNLPDIGDDLLSLQVEQ